MAEQKLVKKRTVLSALFWFLAIPTGLGLLCGYGLHRYQASQIHEDFSPYGSAKAELSSMPPEGKAFSYIAKPLDVEFGEVENYKRYRTEWEIFNSGKNALQMELASQTCEVEFDGKPMRTKEAIPGGSRATIALSWVVDSSDKEFRQELVLKTNDGVESKRKLEFLVFGTVNPAIEVLPPILDFGTLTSGQTKELTARVQCYRTKTFKIEDFSFSDESLRAGFDVKIVEIEELQGLGGPRTPASAFSVVVTVKADMLQKKSYSESLLLQSNLPQTEGLKIGLEVAVQ